MSIKADEPDFEFMHSYGTVSTNTHSISLQPVHLVALVQVSYTDGHSQTEKVSDNKGVWQVHSKYTIGMGDDHLEFDGNRGVSLVAGGVVASNSAGGANRLPTPINSTFNWWKGMTPEEVFESLGN